MRMRSAGPSLERAYRCEEGEGLPGRVESDVADGPADKDEEERPEGKDAEEELGGLEEGLAGEGEVCERCQGTAIAANEHNVTRRRAREAIGNARCGAWITI